MRQIRQHKIRKVIVYKLDRISRSLSDFVSILKEFKENKVEFVSSQESFDTSSPYGELIVKILMVFAEFERTSIINRITQAYAHRSELGFYMGGRKPYGFELVPTVINNIKTKKLHPIHSETEILRYIFEVYAVESVSLRRLRDILISENRQPETGSTWTTAKLSTILKNPIYVKADVDIFDYYEKHGTQLISEPAMFTGTYGAQLYGSTKHNPASSDWSDMKLVLLTHRGVVDSDIWLECQRKLEKNRQLGNSLSNRTSWLAGKIICKKCGHTMTTIKGKVDKDGTQRRYFICTGKSHKRICTGPMVSIYAEDLENFVYECVSKKLLEFNGVTLSRSNAGSAEANDLKLKIKALERNERQLIDSIISGGCNEALMTLANHKATQLRQDKTALCNQLEMLSSSDNGIVVNLSGSWKNADYVRKKDVTGIILHKIIISETGDAKITWNI